MKRNLELEATIVEKYAAVEAFLDERGRRKWTATESRAIGYGGDALVSDATGLSRRTTRAGRRELEPGGVERGRLRRPGAGRPSIEQSQPGELFRVCRTSVRAGRTAAIGVDNRNAAPRIACVTTAYAVERRPLAGNVHRLSVHRHGYAPSRLRLKPTASGLITASAFPVRVGHHRYRFEPHPAGSKDL